MQILLIGPMGIGKSTLAARLAALLNLPLVDVDELRWHRFAQMPGYDNATVKTLFDSGATEQAFAYLKPFEAQLVENLLATPSEGIYDFGAGYTVYDDPALFARVQAAFAPYENVIFLRYSADPEETLAALLTRHTEIPEPLYYAMNRPFIESPCNAQLAKHTIDTKGKTVDEIAAEALCLVD